MNCVKALSNNSSKYSNTMMCEGKNPITLLIGTGIYDYIKIEHSRNMY